MSVKVKRKLWVFGAFMPVSLRYNDKPAGALYGSQEMIIPMEEEVGELKYFQWLGRKERLKVSSGDVLEIEETVIGKVFSFMFVLLMLYLFIRGFGFLDYTGFSNYEQIVNIEHIVMGIILITAAAGFFFKTHKLILVNEQPG